MCKITFLGFLFVAAAWDFRNREIPALLYVVGAMVAVVVRILEWYCFRRNFINGQLLVSMGIGGALLIMAAASKGSIGMGDGLFFVVSGLYLNYQENLILLLNSVLAAGLFCLGWSLWRRMKGDDIRSLTIPFLPFVVPGALLIALRSGGG